MKWLPQLSAVVLGVALAGVSPAVQAENQAESLLQQMTQANRSLDFVGRFVYQHGAQLSTMELRHAVIDGVQHQRLTHLDGPLVEFVRRGDDVVCLHPDKSTTRMRGSAIVPMTLGERVAQGLPDYYNVLDDGDDRVAGRAATRIRVAPLDDDRFGYRLWLDKDAQVLLKSEVVDARGIALERMEFISLRLNPGLTADDFVLEENDRPERVIESVPSQAVSASWTMRLGWLPKGFELQKQEWRQNESHGPMLAQGYSDGLSAFTLFVEPAGATANEGVSRTGATLAMSRYLSVDGQPYRLSFVGEMPQKTAEKIIADAVLANE